MTSDTTLVRLFCGCLVTRAAMHGIVNTCPLCGQQRPQILGHPDRHEELSAWGWIAWLLVIAGAFFYAARYL